MSAVDAASVFPALLALHEEWTSPGHRRLRFTTDHTGRAWYPLSTAQWGVPHLPDESDARWRERVLRHAADDEGLGW